MSPNANRRLFFYYIPPVYLWWSYNAPTGPATKYTQELGKTGMRSRRDDIRQI